MTLLFFFAIDPEDVEEEEDYVCVTEHVHCPAIPHSSPQSLQAAMQLLNIQTLAFTPPQTLPWRVYLYANTENTHTASTPSNTLILGELLYTGEANQNVKGKGNGNDAHKVVTEGREEEQVEQEEEAPFTGLGRSVLQREEREDREVKITLKQQPRDNKALRGFLSILTTVLHTLSSERA